METAKVCKNYFIGFNDIKNLYAEPKPQAAKVALAVIKIFSYFTVILPLIFGIAYAATLIGRTEKLPSDNDALNHTAKKVADYTKDHFYIVGGGIAGLNTALLLMHKGVPGKNITLS